MNIRRQQTLEEMVKNAEESRTAISDILVRDFPVERDVADIIAFDATNQAIGLDNVKDYDKIQRRKKLAKIWAKVCNLQWKKYFNTGLKSVVVVLLVSFLLWGIFSIGSCSYQYATRPNPPEYPKTYHSFPETLRLKDFSVTDHKGYLLEGRTSSDRTQLNNRNNLCLVDNKTPTSEKGNTKNCIHRNKLERFNATLEAAYKRGVDGIVWDEPNGNGEWWQVELNNYRFAVTAEADPNFK